MARRSGTRAMGTLATKGMETTNALAMVASEGALAHCQTAASEHDQWELLWTRVGTKAAALGRSASASMGRHSRSTALAVPCSRPWFRVGRPSFTILNLAKAAGMIYVQVRKHGDSADTHELAQAPFNLECYIPKSKQCRLRP